jgi:hypothetical protein
MSWQKLDLDKETMFLSEATDYDGVQADLMTVINRMMENKIEDAVTEGAALLFYTNATNGYIKISWYNPENDTFAGNVSYYLELKTLWNMSLEHEDGAYFFDKETHIGICCAYEEYFDDFGDVAFDVFTSNELQTEAEQLFI